MNRNHELPTTFRKILHNSPDKQDDKRFVLLACLSNPLEFQHASERLRDDRDIVLAALRDNGDSREMRYRPQYRDVAQAGWAHDITQRTQRVSPLVFASARRRDDALVIRAAITQSPSAFQWASRRLQESPDMCIFAIGLQPGVYSLFSDEMKLNRLVCSAVLRAMHAKRARQYQNDGHYMDLSHYMDLEISSKPFESVLRFPLKKTGCETYQLPQGCTGLVLSGLSDPFNGTYQPVVGVVVHGGAVLENGKGASCFRSSNTGKWLFTKDESLVTANRGCFRIDSLLEGTSVEFSNGSGGGGELEWSVHSEARVAYAITTTPKHEVIRNETTAAKYRFKFPSLNKDGHPILQLFPKELWNDVTFCNEAMAQVGAAISFVPEDLLTQQMILTAVEYDPRLLQFVLNNNLIVESTVEDLCLSALARSNATVGMVPNYLWESRTFVENAVVIDPGFILLASEHFLNDMELAKIVVKQHSPSLQYFSDRIRDDNDVVTIAVSSYGGLALAFASDRLRANVNIVQIACECYDFEYSDRDHFFKPRITLANNYRANESALPLDAHSADAYSAKGIGQHPFLFASILIQSSPHFVRSMMGFYLPYDCQKAVVLSFLSKKSKSNKSSTDLVRVRVGATQPAMQLILEFARTRISKLNTTVLTLANPMIRAALEPEIKQELQQRKDDLLSWTINAEKEIFDGTKSIRERWIIEFKGVLNTWLYTKEHLKNSFCGKEELEKRINGYKHRLMQRSLGYKCNRR